MVPYSIRSPGGISRRVERGAGQHDGGLDLLLRNAPIGLEQCCLAFGGNQFEAVGR
jgi:hypothetical protein